MTTLPPPVARISRAAQLILGVSIVAQIGVNLVYGPQIGAERLPMQWSLSGEPTWFAPRLLSLWGLPVVTAAGGAILVLTGRIRSSSNDPFFWPFLIVFSAIMVGAHIFHVSSLMRWVGH